MNKYAKFMVSIVLMQSMVEASLTPGQTPMPVYAGVRNEENDNGGSQIQQELRDNEVRQFIVQVALPVATPTPRPASHVELEKNERLVVEGPKFEFNSPLKKNDSFEDLSTLASAPATDPATDPTPAPAPAPAPAQAPVPTALTPTTPFPLPATAPVTAPAPQVSFAATTTPAMPTTLTSGATSGKLSSTTSNSASETSVAEHAITGVSAFVPVLPLTSGATLNSAPEPAPVCMSTPKHTNKVTFKPTVWSRLGFDTSSKVWPSSDPDNDQTQTSADFGFVNTVMQRDKIYLGLASLLGFGSYVAVKNDKPEVAAAAGLLSIGSLANSIWANVTLRKIEKKYIESMPVAFTHDTIKQEWFEEWRKEHDERLANNGERLKWQPYLQQKKQEQLNEIRQKRFKANVDAQPSVIRTLLTMKPKNTSSK